MLKLPLKIYMWLFISKNALVKLCNWISTKCPII